MKKRLLSILCCALVLGMNVSPIVAQTEFKNALQDKYDFKTVSCYTCHMRKSEVAEDKLEEFAKNAKSFRDDFGQQFDKLLKGKEVTARLDAVKDLDKTDAKRIKVEDEVTKEFLEALDKVEQVKSPNGKTYGELLKSGELDGVTPK